MRQAGRQLVQRQGRQAQRPLVWACLEQTLDKSAKHHPPRPLTLVKLAAGRSLSLGRRSRRSSGMTA